MKQLRGLTLHGMTTRYPFAFLNRFSLQSKHRTGQAETKIMDTYKGSLLRARH